MTAPTPTRTPTPTERNALITRRAEQGEDLTAISRDYAMSRERVRQIVAKHTSMSPADLSEARRRRHETQRANIQTLKVDEIREAARTHPDATIGTLADLTGYPTALVRTSLDWAERERRSDQQNYACAPDAEVLAEMRRVADLPGGTPLTGGFYDQHRTPGVGVSHARLLQKYGTWTSACQAAQVTPRGPNPGRTYTRNWTTNDMTQWVWDYLIATETPTYARFEAWLRTQDGAPSAQTIRNTLGSWIEMKRLAIDANLDTVAP